MFPSLSRHKAYALIGTVGWLLLLMLAAAAHTDETEFRVRLGEKMLLHYIHSPRSAGLGGSYAALNDGAHGVYQNPASLGALSSHEVFSHLSFEQINEGGRHAEYYGGTYGGGFHFASWRPDYYSREQMGNQALALRYTHLAGDAGGSNGFDQGTNLLTVGYGRSFNYGRVLAGTSFGTDLTSWGDNDELDTDLCGYELRNGLIVRLTREFSLGAVVSLGWGDYEENLITGNYQGDLAWREFRLGGALRLNDAWLLTSDIAFQNVEKAADPAPDRELEEHSVIRWSAGGELIVVPETVTARGGVFVVNDDFDVENLPGLSDRNHTYGGLSLGASYYRDNWSLGYNARVTTEGDHGHFANMLLDF